MVAVMEHGCHVRGAQPVSEGPLCRALLGTDCLLYSGVNMEGNAPCKPDFDCVMMLSDVCEVGRCWHGCQWHRPECRA